MAGPVCQREIVKDKNVLELGGEAQGGRGWRVGGPPRAARPVQRTPEGGATVPAFRPGKTGFRDLQQF